MTARARCALSLLVTLCSAIPSPALAGTLKRDYEFAGNLADSLGVPALKAFGGTVGDHVYTFAAGQGLRLKGAGIKDHYAIEITFRFDNVTDYRKILDVMKLRLDLGLYLHNGSLVYYDLTDDSGTIGAGQIVTVRLERHQKTKMVRGFINGQLVFEFHDRDGQAKLKSSIFHFFIDDHITDGAEVSDGAVTRIRIFKGTISDSM